MAVTLDAVLQWIAPSVAPASETGFAKLFAESLKFQLLPQDNFLDVGDFCLLLDMGLTCESLPAQDVEACIRHIRATGPGLDPAHPADRERLHHLISKFFADPGREYHKNLERIKSAKDFEIADLKEQLRVSTENAAMNRTQIQGLETRLASLDREGLAVRRRRTAIKRGALGLAVTGIWEAAICWLAYDPAANASFLKQMNDISFLLAAFGAIGIAITSWFVGGEGLRSLGINPHPSTLDSTDQH